MLVSWNKIGVGNLWQFFTWLVYKIESSHLKNLTNAVSVHLNIFGWYFQQKNICIIFTKRYLKWAKKRNLKMVDSGSDDEGQTTITLKIKTTSESYEITTKEQATVAKVIF